MMSQTVIVVNEDKTQREWLCGLARRAGLTPVGCQDAQEALGILDPGGPPALMVTDLHLPGMDGWRFCRLLRSPEFRAFNQTPILVVSASYSGKDATVITRELGANAFLPLPIEGSEIIEKIRLLVAGQLALQTPQALIVEDDRCEREALRWVLEGHGYRAQTAANCQAAADVLARTDFDLVVLDYHLSDGQGDTLLAEWRRSDSIGVWVMITGDPRPELALDWIRKGASAYIRKPFAPEYLLQVCDTARRERALLRAQELLTQRTLQLQRQEEALRASDDRFKNLLKVVPTVSVQGYSPDGIIHYWNHASEIIYGFSALEAIGHDLVELIIPAAMREGVREAIRQSANSGIAIPAGELVLMRKDGSPVSVFSSHAVLKRPDGGVEVFCIDIDLTERKRAEEERLRLNDQLRQAMKMEAVGRLAGGVAHDFNNMLTVILGDLTMVLTDTPPGDPRAEMLEEAKKAAESAESISRQLLTFSRKQIIQPRVLDLNELIKHLHKMLARLIGADIEICRMLGANLGYVKADPGQIEQVLVNLAVNARDAMPGGGRMAIETGNVEIDAGYAQRHALAAPGPHVRLAVSDTGCGMNQEVKQHLFEPFFTTKPKERGTGLGLATIFGIVRQAGGSIEVDSEVGRGTTFTIYLPRAIGSIQARETTVPVNGATILSGGGERILLVEDEPGVRDLTARVLRRGGYQVWPARNGQEALAIAENQPDGVDLLMTDMVMPGMTGRELAKRMRQIYPRLPVLFSSGYTDDALTCQGDNEAHLNFIGKPYLPQALTGKIRQIMARKT